MSMIKWNRDKGIFPTIPTFFDYMGWDDDLVSTFWNGKKLPAVNISEEKETFLVEVAVPGMKKDDFKISMDEGMLTISAETESEKETKVTNFPRREYNFETFERSFRLPENVAEENVLAKYENGVLKIQLNKVEF